MRQIWSEVNKRRIWRQIWVALAEAQYEAGLVRAEEVNDLRLHQNDVDINRALEIEREIHHDLMAEVHTYAEQCKVGGGIIHLGATSMDIEDNADALRIRDSLSLILEQLRTLLSEMCKRIEETIELVCMAYTHLQPAEPTTVGYRLANYAQDLYADWSTIKIQSGKIRGKGIKGAVGNAASYHELLHGASTPHDEFENRIMDALGIHAFDIAHQTYPRRQDWETLNALAGVAMSVYRFAFDLRLLQSPSIGEWSEPFGKTQVGSSAMPFKRNPINAENIDSLARYVATLPRVAWDNAAHCLLERTLDDSGNRRVFLPNAFLAASELLTRTHKILRGLKFNHVAIERNLTTYGVFAATERVLMEASKQGGDRQKLHNLIRSHSMIAWKAVERGEPNPLRDLILGDAEINALVAREKIVELLAADAYIGDAPQRALRLVETIRDEIN